MLELLLIRHGQTDWNAERKVMGKEPIGLNTTGREQIQKLAEALSSFPLDFIYSSPLKRTLETAEILNQGRSLEVGTTPELCEIEYGVWVGKTFSEIRSTPGFIDPYAHPHLAVAPEGESLEQVRERAVRFTEGLKNNFKKGRGLVITHADWIKVVLLHYLGLSLSQIRQFRIDNASLSYLILEEKIARVIAINHTVNFNGLFASRFSLSFP